MEDKFKIMMDKQLGKPVTTKEQPKKLPSNFGAAVMEFAKISTDTYHSGSLVGQLTVLKELKSEIQHKIDKVQDRYDQTEVGAIMKKTRDG